MAFIGMRYPVIAKVSSYVAGQEPTYTAGMVMGHAISGNLTITRNNNPLHGDDSVIEDDNGITAMSLEMGLDDLMEDVQVYMGLLKANGANADDYLETGGSSNEVGMGYIRVRRKGGITKYQAVWMYRGIFGPTSENTQTKGQSIEWQTPTVTGNIMATEVDASGDIVFRRKALFNSYEAAKSWLNTRAGIVGGTLSSITVASAAGTSSGKTALTLSGYTLPEGASYVYKTDATSAPAVNYGLVPDYTWTPWDGTSQLTITNGHKITVAAINGTGQVIASGSATVISAT